jgi:hypothetical protein
MKVLVLAVLTFALTASVCIAAELEPQVKKEVPELKCYLPYSVKKDHMVMGCEVAGYNMRYDLAQKSGVFMILLPNGANSIKEASTYFSVQTVSFEGRSLQQLIDADIKGILTEKPGTEVIKNLSHSFPSHYSACLGVELAYPAASAAFPNESFYLCDTGSKYYAIVLSLGGRSKNAMDEAYPTFLNWMDIPHMVKDAKITDK